METIKLTLEEQQNIEFKLEVEGGEVEEVRFCIEDGKTLFCWVGKRKKDNTYSFDIDLSKIRIKEETLHCFLEVFVAGKRFTPFFGFVVFESKISVRAKLNSKSTLDVLTEEKKTHPTEEQIKTEEVKKKKSAKPIIRLVI